MSISKCALVVFARPHMCRLISLCMSPGMLSVWMALISRGRLVVSPPGAPEGCWCAQEAFYHETRVSWLGR